MANWLDKRYDLLYHGGWPGISVVCTGNGIKWIEEVIKGVEIIILLCHIAAATHTPLLNTVADIKGQYGNRRRALLGHGIL